VVDSDEEIGRGFAEYHLINDESGEGDSKHEETQEWRDPDPVVLREVPAALRECKSKSLAGPHRIPWKLHRKIQKSAWGQVCYRKWRFGLIIGWRYTRWKKLGKWQW